MNRFQVLFSGAALIAVTANSLWGQVPVVQPKEVVLRAPTSSEIPVVSPADLLPAKSMPQGNKAILRTDSEPQGGLKSVPPNGNQTLPAIVRPQTSSGTVS